MARLILALAVLALAACVCQAAQTCGTEKVVQNFNYKKYSKTWYMMKGPNSLSAAGKCTKFTYEFTDDNRLLITSSFTNPETLEESILHPAAVLPEEGLSKEARIQFSENGAATTYNVLAVSYNKYAVVHICNSQGDMYLVLSPRPKLDWFSKIKVKCILRRLGVPTSELVDIVQDCQ